jgi:hypothetical protein
MTDTVVLGHGNVALFAAPANPLGVLHATATELIGFRHCLVPQLADQIGNGPSAEGGVNLGGCADLSTSDGCSTSELELGESEDIIAADAIFVGDDI